MKVFIILCPSPSSLLWSTLGTQLVKSACKVGCLGSIPEPGRSHRRGKWQPSPVLLPGRFHGQRSLGGCSPWGCKEMGMTEWLTVSLSLPWPERIMLLFRCLWLCRGEQSNLQLTHYYVGDPIVFLPVINCSLISNASVSLEHILWINNYGEIGRWLHKTHKQANWLKEVAPVWDHFLVYLILAGLGHGNSGSGIAL